MNECCQKTLFKAMGVLRGLMDAAPEGMEWTCCGIPIKNGKCQHRDHHEPPYRLRALPRDDWEDD